MAVSLLKKTTIFCLATAFMSNAVSAADSSSSDSSSSDSLAGSNDSPSSLAQIDTENMRFLIQKPNSNMEPHFLGAKILLKNRMQIIWQVIPDFSWELEEVHDSSEKYYHLRAVPTKLVDRISSKYAISRVSHKLKKGSYLGSCSKNNDDICLSQTPLKVKVYQDSKGLRFFQLFDDKSIFWLKSTFFKPVLTTDDSDKSRFELIEYSKKCTKISFVRKFFRGRYELHSKSKGGEECPARPDGVITYRPKFPLTPFQMRHTGTSNWIK